MPRLLILISNGAFFLSHRLSIALKAQAAGYEVAIACPTDGSAAKIVRYGLRHIPIIMCRNGSTPLSEVLALFSVGRAIRSFKPDLIHQITAKPIIYGGLWARLWGVPTVSAISGLGYLFINDGLRIRLMRELVKIGYRMAVSGQRSHLIFQNEDDLRIFGSLRLVGRARYSLIRGGSGVDLDVVQPAPIPSGETVLVLPARLIRDKGVVEFVEAARLLKSRGIRAKFRLLGDPDAGNPTSVTHAELQEWQDQGLIEWHRYTENISAALAKCHIVVLPSYREGFPKTLIDAAAAGRASAAADVPGSRDAIVVGKTGVLFAARDAVDMARALEPLINNRGLQISMGRAARRHAEAHFDIRNICDQHIEIYSMQKKLA